MSPLLAAIRRSDKILYFCGWANLLLLCCFLLAAPWDDRVVVNLNPWLKPIKFAASIALYCWTMALFLGMLPPLPRLRKVTAWGIVGAMTVEIALIALQSARGEPSHFNVKTPFDAQVFATMGSAILLNTFLAAFVLFQFLWQEVKHPRALVMGVRLGLVVFLMASMEGMIIVLNQGHTVGGADGGPGLPLVDWSTRHGDLRVAHAWGLHALQGLPLVGWVVSRRMGGSSLAAQLGVVAGAGLVWIAVFVYLFSRAMAGRPLVAM